MITFAQHGKRFKFRVAGLCTYDKYVLLTTADQEDYWIMAHDRLRDPPQTG